MNSKDIFSKNGYVFINNFFSVDESKKIVGWADDLSKWEECAFKWMIYYEDSSNVKNKARVENFLEYHKDMNQFVRDKLTPTVNDIYNEDMVLFKEKINWKLANGKGFKAHQDQPAWTDFPPNKYVTVVLFANNSTVENGCLEIAKTDRIDKIVSYNESGSGEIDKTIEDSYEWDHITATPRDILLFDSYVIHRSDDNKTNESRRHFYFTYNPKSDGDFYNEYLEKKRKEFPPEIERHENKTYNIMGNKYNLANPIN